MPNKKEDQLYIAARKGETDLMFRGILLAEVHESRTYGYAKAWIYRTTGGNYVAQYVVANSSGEFTEQRAAKCVDAAEIRTFYTIQPSQPAPAKRARGGGKVEPPVKPQPGHLLDIGKEVLEQAGKVDPNLKDAHVEFID